MKSKYIHLFVLLSIFSLGTFLRFFRITSVPPSLSHDETAIAYNAYSLLTTGKDEYGNASPILFTSFDDYKLPGMVYSTIPFVALFGRSELAARMPSALYGSLTILLIYFIVLELMSFTRIQNSKSTLSHPQIYALSAAFFFAISPWHINFSRQLFESNGALFFISIATYFLCVSFKKAKALLLSALFYGISVYFYYSVRLVIPFIALTYIILQRKQVRTHIWIMALSIILFIITVFPIGIKMFTKGGLERVSMVSIVNDTNYLAWKDTFVNIYAKNQNIVFKILFNQKTALVMGAADNYWKNIAPLHMFADGTMTYGLQHPLELPFILIGIIFLLSLTTPIKWVLVAWFLSAILPGAFSTNQPNALRTLLGAPFLSLCAGLGAVELMRAIDKTKRTIIGYIPFSLLGIFFFYAFYQSYFVVNPNKNARAFGDGYKQMITYVRSHEPSYDRVVISGYYWRPYIFMLYWGDVDPHTYQRIGSLHGWDKYVFTGAEWDKNDVFLYSTSYDPTKLVNTTKEKTLFILAYPEYMNNKQKYTYLDTISGIHASDVFIAATAK